MIRFVLSLYLAAVGRMGCRGAVQEVGRTQGRFCTLQPKEGGGLSSRVENSQHRNTHVLSKHLRASNHHHTGRVLHLL